MRLPGCTSRRSAPSNRHLPSVSHAPGQTSFELSDLSQEMTAVGRAAFGSGRWRGGAQVGHQIREGKIHLVPDPGHDRQARGENRPHHSLFVEGPQVFQRSAATRDDQHVYFISPVRVLNGADQPRNRGDALNGRGVQNDRNPRAAPGQHVQDVADSSARGRSHHTDRTRCRRYRFLVCFIEKTGGRQTSLQGFKAQAECALASGFHVLHDHLELTARLIERHPGRNQDLRAVGGRESQKAVARLEHGTPHLGRRVLQGEVEVAGGRPREIRDFTLYPHRPEMPFQQ